MAHKGEGKTPEPCALLLPSKYMMNLTSTSAVVLMLCYAGRLGAADEVSGTKAPAQAADTFAKKGNIPPKIVRLTAEQEAAILKDVKVADGFDVTLFANSAAANYPVFVAAAPDGTLYVSSDGNGSLGRAPNRGRVIRLRDLDGDGRADETKVFCDVDAPRGLVWDHDRLLLVHPPHLSEFIDADGDGVAEKENVLVKNIAFGYDKRPADHTTNGLSLGIDGWLYIAGGDFGFMNAEGTDGRKLTHRGGGVIRVRPDGTGLEMYSTGTRNILEVAISPLMDMFARDNTNDGGGWNVRFHHFTGGDDHGYPRLYKNFPDECIAPIADYGGGSGCGAVYIDEPGFGKWNNAPFTCDWGTGALYHHKLKPKGATFEETRKPEPFVKMTRPTDADVDAMSHLYVASWKGATFDWAGPDVGYIVRVTPKSSHLAPRDERTTTANKNSPGKPNGSAKGASPLVSRSETATFLPPLPDFAKASDEELVKVLESASHRRRMEAQRELVRRLNKGAVDAKSVGAIRTLVRDLDKPPPVRIAGLATSAFAEPAIRKLTSSASVGTRGRNSDSKAIFYEDAPTDAAILPWTVRLASEHEQDAQSEDPRVKLAVLGNFYGDKGYYKYLNLKNVIAMLNDADAVVKHAANRALADAFTDLEKPPFWSGPFEYPFPNPEKKPWGTYLLSFLPIDKASPEADAAFKMLGRTRNIHIVTGLIERLGKATDPALRQGILAALCRLHFKEGEWKGDSWGTRPDTRGPYYQPEAWSETPKIAAALKEALAKAAPEEAAFLVKEMNRNRIQSSDALQRILALAKQDAKVIPDAVAQLAVAEEVPADAVPMLVGVLKSGAGFQLAGKDGQAGSLPHLSATLAGAIIALSKTDSAEGVSATLAALEPLRKLPESEKDYDAATTAFFNTPKLENHHLLVEQIAEKREGRAAVFADAALLHLASRKSGSPESIQLSQKALDTGWTDAARRAQILEAIGLIKHQPSAGKVMAALDDADPSVKQAAARTAKAMRFTKIEDKTPKLSTLKPEDALAAVLKEKGDVGLGEQIFTRATCAACHTTKESEPPKGPYLGNIAQTYKRPDLAMNILDPNKTIAQGFATELITLKDGTQQMGFITLEGAAEVKIRNIAAQEFIYKTADITKRDKLPMSIMPPGLMMNFTVKEFASLLDYLESLVKK